jgi:hypothetical protein
MSRSLIIGMALLASATSNAYAQTVDARILQGTNESAVHLESPLRLDNGEIVVVESDARSQDFRRLRFGEDGQWHGELAFSGKRRTIALANGEFLSVQNTQPHDGDCDIAGLSRQFEMKWRHTDLIGDDDEFDDDECGRFDADALDQLWYADADWKIGRLHRDGTLATELDLSDVVPSSQTVQVTALAAARGRGGAYYALADVFDDSDTEILHYDEHMVLQRRAAPQLPSGAGLQIDALYPLASGDVVGIGISRYSGDSNGTLHFVRQAANVDGPHVSLKVSALQSNAILASHRFDDGSFGVLYQSPPVPPQTSSDDSRVALLAADGTTIADFYADNDLQAVPYTSFVQLTDGTHWLITNHGPSSRPRGVAMSLDGNGAQLELDIGQQTGVIARSDGTALVFGSELGNRVLRFDGSSAREMLTFSARSPLGDRLIRDETRKLADGGHLLLWHEERSLRPIAARLDANGAVRWQSALADLIHPEVIAWVPSRIFLLAEHVCLLNASLDLFEWALECRRLDNGTQSLLLPLGDMHGAPLVAESASGIDLLYTDANYRARYRHVFGDTPVATERDLGNGEAAWLEPGYAIARSQEHRTITIMPSRDAPLVTHTLNDNSNDVLWRQIVARDGGDVITYILLGDLGRVEFRRLHLTGELVWERELNGVNFDLDWPIIRSGETVQLSLRADDTRWLHTIRRDTGAVVGVPARISPWHSPWVHSIDPTDGTLQVAIGEPGRIDWRSFDSHGAPLGVTSFRCPADCTPQSVSPDGREVTAFVEDAVTDGALLAFTLPERPTARRAPVVDEGVAGVFIATNDTNRGYVVDWLPSARVLFVARFAGDASETTTRELLEWETMQGVVGAGSSAVTLPRYRNAGGRFAAGDDAPIIAFGSATFRFDGCDAAELELTDASGTTPTSEIVHLRRSGPRLKTCRLLDGMQIAAQAVLPARGGFDPRQSGAWVAAGASDQGLLAAVLPASANTNGVFFAPWFTYWTDASANPGTGNRHWLTLQGTLTPATNGSTALTIYRATAGSHGPIRPSNTYRVGTATWTLTDCEHATLSYQFDADASAQPYSGRSGVQNYARPGACSGGP